MCWNAPVSLTAFIVGLLVCISIAILAYREEKYELMALSVGWIYVIFMQLWEYFIWKYPKKHLFVGAAYIFNITQIIVLGLVFLTFFTDQSIVSRSIVFLILVLYTAFFLIRADQRPVITRTSNHLEYHWWTLPYAPVIYIGSFILIFLFIVRPWLWSLFTLALLVFFLILSRILFSRSVASMWCFFAVSVPALSYFISLFTYEKK